ncbi:stretch-activated Ca2+-permeable channel component-domain-containing protein [Endogone sp. FLAS-F59071]|nr:stretch-activated Ca2+-permeable channel component-domain-containing protein [Endogone sp. FLAS-F59071]|eukprot:RUS21475.1 stretch-activated Ca2+-permeable channel component-domain-containing protein [Endogone sp. FLAS-F59071]
MTYLPMSDKALFRREEDSGVTGLDQAPKKALNRYCTLKRTKMPKSRSSLHFILLAALLLPNYAVSQSVTVQLNDTQAVSGIIFANTVNHYFFQQTTTVLVALSQSPASSPLESVTTTSAIQTTSSRGSKHRSKTNSVNSATSTSRPTGGKSHNKRAGSIEPTGNLFITLTTCSQPTGGSGSPGALQLYVSNSSQNSLPGPQASPQVSTSNDPTRDGGIFAGFLSISLPLSQASSVWIGVSAPQLQGQGWTGNWTYQLGVSTQGPMHIVESSDIISMTLDDTDLSSALFLTSNYTGTNPPVWKLVITADGLPSQLSRSLCAAELYQVQVIPNVTTTQRGPQNGNKQQAYVSGLQSGKNYSAYYVMESTSQPGVGMISQPITFKTKSAQNCRLIYNLPFCDQVAYSVPSNVTGNPDLNNLALTYDQNAQSVHSNFSLAISQFNCDTTRYSLVRTCTDCINDYKRWLCAVTIPRCADDTVPMNVFNQFVNTTTSRNPWFNTTGSWNELLPCADLCYNIVQSCPPFLNFVCPPNLDLMLQQYGFWLDNSERTNQPTCNSLGLNFSIPPVSMSAVRRWW